MVWRHLGFQRNIFFVEPLTPTEEDMKLFVGRDNEINRFLIDVLSDQRALKIVSGEIGVGKTTFVNACQFFCYTGNPPSDFKFEISRVLPCFEKIQIRETDTLDELTIKTIVTICRSIAFHCKMENVSPPKEVQQILNYFMDLAFDSGGSGYTAGGSIVGTGAQFGRTKESKVPNILRNARLQLKNLIDLIRNDLGFAGVFIVVNNLDILTKPKLTEFLNDGRDELFDITGIYWTLIGHKGIGSIIETECERVADYLSGVELHIDAFNFNGMKQVIEKRVEEFRIDENRKCPLTFDTIEAFYYFSVQELRETFRICSEITKSVLLLDPSLEVIPPDMAMRAFQGYAHNRAKDMDLSESSIRVLKAVYDRKSCRPKDYEQFGYKTLQGFIAALKSLVSKKLLSVEEQGRARKYRMTGMTMIAAITGALGDEIQEVVLDKIKSNGTTEFKFDDRFQSAQLELFWDED